MTKRDDGGAAFPQRSDGAWEHDGLSIRDYFAAKAMQAAITEGACRNIAALIREEHDDMDEEAIADAANAQIARLSYRMADFMLLARTSTQPGQGERGE